MAVERAGHSCSPSHVSVRARGSLLRDVLPRTADVNQARLVPLAAVCISLREAKRGLEFTELPSSQNCQVPVSFSQAGRHRRQWHELRLVHIRRPGQHTGQQATTRGCGRM